MDAISHNEVDPRQRDKLSRQVDALAWGSFLVWIGVALFANISWNWWFVGVGIIILTAESIRKARNLPWSGFWVACGAIFLIGGVWEISKIGISLAPILLIAYGLLVIWKALAGNYPLSH